MCHAQFIFGRDLRVQSVAVETTNRGHWPSTVMVIINARAAGVHISTTIVLTISIAKPFTIEATINLRRSEDAKLGVKDLLWQIYCIFKCKTGGWCKGFTKWQVNATIPAINLWCLMLTWRWRWKSHFTINRVKLQPAYKVIVMFKLLLLLMLTDKSFELQ